MNRGRIEGNWKESCGISKEETEKQFAEWQERMKDANR